MTASTAMSDIVFAHTHSAPIGRNFLFGFRSTVRLVALEAVCHLRATFPLAMSVKMAVISMRSALSFVRGYTSSRVQPSRSGAAPRVRRLSINLATSLLSNVTRGALTAGSGYTLVGRGRQGFGPARGKYHRLRLRRREERCCASRCLQCAQCLCASRLVYVGRGKYLLCLVGCRVLLLVLIADRTLPVFRGLHNTRHDYYCRVVEMVDWRIGLCCLLWLVRVD
ncbi:hypothetical protein C3747_802g10 [Trypanosoma cruzi]|uniref:Uncharacterized protein n=1 Tax=Trypanosoma cruzi TaxID=5693 RepID=A0A2V2UNT4_TRYCR|nr:hypothetical protein C3747_802g10 [Trypanosoma cruzi]